MTMSLDTVLMPFHILGGSVAIVGGYIALFAGKGTRLHRKTGTWFVVAMIGLGVTASVISFVRQAGAGGLLPIYLVVTGLATVRPLGSHQRRLDVAGLVVAAILAIGTFVKGVDIQQNYGGVRDGVPAGMLFFLGTITLLAGIGDLRVILSGPLRGAARIARHLWRMTFSLFIATGSFFLGQADELPAFLRIWPALWVLALAPLPLLLYWMWRVRLRRSLRGMQLLRPDAPATVSR
jgi:uncharacterized membrane protein